MCRRRKKAVEKKKNGVAFGRRSRYKERVHWAAAQPGWRISGEVVILVAQAS
jgi:hypothetical protein